MKLAKYILTSNNYAGKFLLTYRDGTLYSFINEFQNLNERQFDSIIHELPYEEINVEHLKEIGLQLKADLKTNEKIALWCRVYKEERGHRYVVSDAQAGMIRTLMFDEEILRYYFRSDVFEWKDKYSIQNFKKYYNEIIDKYHHRSEIAKPKSKHPNSFSATYIKEKRLSPVETQEYYTHLRSLGLEPVRVHGEVVDFKPKAETQTPSIL